MKLGDKKYFDSADWARGKAHTDAPAHKPNPGARDRSSLRNGFTAQAANAELAPDATPSATPDVST